MQVVVDSLLTNYERQGDAKRKSILILPGWADSIKSWTAVQEMLATDYDVCVLDLPGFGGSEAPKEPWSLDDFATHVAHFLDKIRLKPQVIIGHSNGGAIAIRGLGQGLLNTDKLVLLASAGIRSEYKGRQRALRLLTKTGKALTYPLPSRVKKHLRRKVYSTIGSDMLVAEHLQETFKKIVTDDIQADASKLQVPTLLVYGEDDLSTPVQHGLLLHHLISGSTLEVLPGAGHFVHLDEPKKVLDMIKGFVR